MADASGSAAAPSLWSTVGTVAPSILQAGGSAVAASQVANANKNAAAGVNAAGANSAALLDPYASQGTAAETQLANLYGLNGSGAQAGAQADFANTPGYQFTKSMGTQAIQRQASATGGEFSSATLGALDQYNTGLAQQTYQNYVQNLFGLVQPGANAAAAAGGQGIEATTQSGKFQVGQGNASASGVANATNAFSNLPPALQRLYGGPTAGGGPGGVPGVPGAGGGSNDAGNYGLGSNGGYNGYVPDNNSYASNNLSNYQEGVDPSQFNNSGYMNWSGNGGSPAPGSTVYDGEYASYY